jgi:hypothetical protein
LGKGTTSQSGTQVVNRAQMMIVVLGDEEAQISHCHRLLETGMQSGAGKFGGSHAGDLFDDGETGFAEGGENFGDRRLSL